MSFPRIPPSLEIAVTLMTAVLGASLLTTEGEQMSVFNCQKADFQPCDRTTKYMRAINTLHGNSKFFYHYLRENGVAFDYGLSRNDTQGGVVVSHNGIAYKAKCPSETVTVVAEATCYADGVVKVVTKDGVVAFADQNHFLMEIATQVACSDDPLGTVLKNKVRKHFIYRQGAEEIALAIHTKNPYFDITKIVNDKSIGRLVIMEEKALNHDTSNGTNTTLSTLLMMHYRRHAFKIQVALLSYRIILDVVLFIAGMAVGLPFAKAVALASGSVKKIIDFKSYLLQSRLTKKEKILKLHRQQLGRDPDADLGRITSNHLHCIYEALLSLTDRCSEMELLLSQILVERDGGRVGKRVGKRVGHIRRGRGSSISSSSSSRSSPRIRLRLPTYQKIKKTATGVVLRTK